MIPSKFYHFVSRNQISAVREGMRGEEEQYFVSTVKKLTELFSSMPKTYEQDGLGDKALVSLHYFLGSSDWWITEKDMEEEDQQQAFGFAVLNGNTQYAELGYINITELIKNGVELDFHFTPKTLGQLKQELGL